MMFGLPAQRFVDQDPLMIDLQLLDHTQRLQNHLVSGRSKPALPNPPCHYSARANNDESLGFIATHKGMKLSLAV